MLDLFTTIDVLTVQEANRKAELEATIERGLQTFVEVGLALMEIREAGLFRPAQTFEEYCNQRWGWTRRHANRMIASAEVTANLGPVGPVLPATERQARPLTPLSPDLQREAWREAVDTAPNGKVTAAHVQAVVDRMTKPEPEDEEPEDGDSCLNCKYNHYNRSSGAQFCAALGIEFDITLCPCNMKRWEPEEEPEPIKLYPIVAANHAETEGDDWCTPIEYVDAVREVLGTIDLDPATNEYGQSIIGASKFYTKQDDGLAHEWQGRVFLNPPYSVPMIDKFASKLLAEYMTGNVTEAIVLTNNSTETQWFQGLLSVCQVVCFPSRRLKFWKSDNEVFATRQGQAFFYFGTSDKFAKVFAVFGTVLKKYDDQ